MVNLCAKEKTQNILIVENLTLFLRSQLIEGKITTKFSITIMTKAEIVSEVAKATGIEKVTVQTVFEAAMESIKGSIVKGEPVYLRGFGSFIIKHRAQKAARNITKKTTITIPAHDIPAFKPSKAFVAELQK